MPNPKGYNQYKRGPGSASKAKAKTTRKGPTAADAIALKAKYPNLPITAPPAGFNPKSKSTTVPPKPRKPKASKPKKPSKPRRYPTRADAIALKAKYPNMPITA